MITIGNFVSALEKIHPEVSFYNGCINKHAKCIGVYARGSHPTISAVGSNPSYGVLPVTMLIHWGEDSDECEIQANALYKSLESGIESINATRVVMIQMLESSPVNIGRDDSNICEMTIRLNIFYERR